MEIDASKGRRANPEMQFLSLTCSAGRVLEGIRAEHSKLNILFTTPDSVEVTEAEASKGNAVHILANRLGINRSEIMAIGDSANDVSMIRYAGLGVAMANAPPEIQDAADYITTGNNNTDGVAETIEKFILQ